MITSLLKSAAIIGTSTVAAAAALQYSYRITGFQPPAPVFWFFSGFAAYLAIEAVEHVLDQEILEVGHALPAT